MNTTINIIALLSVALNIYFIIRMKRLEEDSEEYRYIAEFEKTAAKGYIAELKKENKVFQEWVKPALVKDLKSKTIAELKKLAKKKGISLKGVRKKADIIKLLNK